MEPVNGRPERYPQKRWSKANWLVPIAMDATKMEALEKPKHTVMPMRSDERLAEKIAKEVLSRYPVSSILDIGCGDGIVSQCLPAQVNYRGLDINNACIYEQKHDNPLVSYVEPESIARITSEDGPWDMILLLDVIEHTRGFIELFEQALLSANQCVIVSLPNELFFLDRLRMLAGRELNAHSLDRVGDPEGFKHQYIINTVKAYKILASSAAQHQFRAEEIIERPLIPKNIFYRPFTSLLKRLSNSSFWSQGSIFVFTRFK